MSERSASERGIKRETAFNRWWGEDGRFICARIQSPYPLAAPSKVQKKLMEYGFLWGWYERAKRDRETWERQQSSRQQRGLEIAVQALRAIARLVDDDATGKTLIGIEARNALDMIVRRLRQIGSASSGNESL